MWFLYLPVALASDVHQSCDDGDVAACEQLLAHVVRLQLASDAGPPLHADLLLARVVALRNGESWPLPQAADPPAPSPKRDDQQPARLDGVPLALGHDTGVAWWRTHDGSLDQTVVVADVCGVPVLVGDTVWLVRKTEPNRPTCNGVQGYEARTGRLRREETYDSHVNIGAGESLLFVWRSGLRTDLLDNQTGTWSLGDVGVQSGDLAGDSSRQFFTMHRRGTEAPVFQHSAPCVLGEGTLFCVSEDRLHLERRDADEPNIVAEVLRTIEEPLHVNAHVAFECDGAVLTGFGSPMEFRPCPELDETPLRAAPEGSRVVRGQVRAGSEPAAGTDVFLVPAPSDPGLQEQDWDGYRAASHGRSAVQRTKADEDGQFEFRDVDAAQPWEVHALSASVWATKRLRADAVDLDITLTGLVPSTRRVTVVDRLGRPVRAEVFSQGVGYPTKWDGTAFVPGPDAFAVSGKWWSAPSSEATLKVDRKRPVCTVRTPTGELHPDYPATPCDAVERSVRGVWKIHRSGGDITVPTRVVVTLPDGTPVPYVWLDGATHTVPLLDVPIGPHTLWVPHDQDRFTRLDINVSGDHTLVVSPADAEPLPTAAVVVRDADETPVPGAALHWYHPVQQTDIQLTSDLFGRVYPWVDDNGRIYHRDQPSQEAEDILLPFAPIGVTEGELPDGRWFHDSLLLEVVIKKGSVRMGDVGLAGEPIAPGVFLFPSFELEFSEGRANGLKASPSGSVVAVHSADGALTFLLPGRTLRLEPG